jgi:hypothetical protein
MTFRSPRELYQFSSADNSAPLMRFCLPFSAQTIRVHSTRACLTRYVPLSGFLNLLVAYSSNRPEALFHASDAHGIFPAEFSPRIQHRTFVRIDYPSSSVLLLHLLPPALQQANSQNTPTRKQVRTNRHKRFRALICFRVRSHLALVLPSTSGRYSPGFY